MQETKYSGSPEFHQGRRTSSTFILRRSKMNDREKFLFDLQGFLLIRDFLTKEEVEALNAAIDANMDKKGEDGNSNTGNSKTLAGTHKRGFFFRDAHVAQAVVPTLPTDHCAPE